MVLVALDVYYNNTGDTGGTKMSKTSENMLCYVDILNKTTQDNRRTNDQRPAPMFSSTDFTVLVALRSQL